MVTLSRFMGLSRSCERVFQSPSQFGAMTRHPERGVLFWHGLHKRKTPPVSNYSKVVLPVFGIAEPVSADLITLAFLALVAEATCRESFTLRVICEHLLFTRWNSVLLARSGADVAIRCECAGASLGVVRFRLFHNFLLLRLRVHRLFATHPLVPSVLEEQIGRQCREE